MEFDLVEVVRKASEEESRLGHVDLDLYLYYCAKRDEVTGISKPRGKDIHRDRGISESEISRAKGRLSAKLWIELLGGRRVRPLVGFDSKNCAERKISGEESVRTPKNPPVKFCAQRKNSSQRKICEDSEFCAQSKNCAERKISPISPYKDKNNLTDKKPASLQAGGRAEDFRGEWKREYGRGPDELCDQTFVESMAERAEFRGVDVARVYRRFSARCKRPRTCFRFIEWLHEAPRFGQMKGAESERADGANGASRVNHQAHQPGPARGGRNLAAKVRETARYFGVGDGDAPQGSGENSP